MELMFKQKMFAWFGAFTIFDEEGETVYTVKGKPAFGHKLMVHDAGGNEVAELKEELMHLTPHFRITVGGKVLGEIKGKLSLIKQKFDLDFCGWQVKGDIMGWNYQVVDGAGNVIMHAQKKLWHMTDTYNIEVTNPDDALLCLLIVLAIDAVKAEKEAAAVEIASTN